jgi:hypothetical protein
MQEAFSKDNPNTTRTADNEWDSTLSELQE